MSYLPSRNFLVRGNERASSLLDNDAPEKLSNREHTPIGPFSRIVAAFLPSAAWNSPSHSAHLFVLPKSFAKMNYPQDNSHANDEYEEEDDNLREGFHHSDREVYARRQ